MDSPYSIRNEVGSPPHKDTFRILITTDNHLGYAEDDYIRSEDSFRTFEEALRIGVDSQCDMFLFGGDLFHENKPSRNTLLRTTNLLRHYCMGPPRDAHHRISIVSDESVHFSDGISNLSDPRVSVSIPAFVIHGNHDDPTGNPAISALDILHCSKLLNYFGRHEDPDSISVSPLVLQKGTSLLCLYGVGNLRDERMNALFRADAVHFDRFQPQDYPYPGDGREGSSARADATSRLHPSGRTEGQPCDPTVWMPDETNLFHVAILHQNRCDSQAKRNALNPLVLPQFLNLAVWGHEHRCIPHIQTIHAKRPLHIARQQQQEDKAHHHGDVEQSNDYYYFNDENGPGVNHAEMASFAEQRDPATLKTSGQRSGSVHHNEANRYHHRDHRLDHLQGNRQGNGPRSDPGFDPVGDEDDDVMQWMDVLQPGSTVITSLSPSEAYPKHAFILEVRGNASRLYRVPLLTARQFICHDVHSPLTSEQQSPTQGLFSGLPSSSDDQTELLEQIIDLCDQLLQQLPPRPPIERCGDLVFSNYHVEQNNLHQVICLPLLRIRISDQLFKQHHHVKSHFLDLVANPDDIVHILKTRAPRRSKASIAREAILHQSDGGAPQTMPPAFIHSQDIPDFLRRFLEQSGGLKVIRHASILRLCHGLASQCDPKEIASTFRSDLDSLVQTGSDIMLKVSQMLHQQQPPSGSSSPSSSGHSSFSHCTAESLPFLQHLDQSQLPAQLERFLSLDFMLSFLLRRNSLQNRWGSAHIGALQNALAVDMGDRDDHATDLHVEQHRHQPSESQLQTGTQMQTQTQTGTQTQVEGHTDNTPSDPPPLEPVSPQQPQQPLLQATETATQLAATKVKPELRAMDASGPTSPLANPVLISPKPEAHSETRGNPVGQPRRVTATPPQLQAVSAQQGDDEDRGILLPTVHKRRAKPAIPPIQTGTYPPSAQHHHHQQQQQRMDHPADPVGMVHTHPHPIKRHRLSADQASPNPSQNQHQHQYQRQQHHPQLHPAQHQPGKGHQPGYQRSQIRPTLASVSPVIDLVSSDSDCDEEKRTMAEESYVAMHPTVGNGYSSHKHTQRPQQPFVPLYKRTGCGHDHSKPYASYSREEADALIRENLNQSISMPGRIKQVSHHGSTQVSMSLDMDVEVEVEVGGPPYQDKENHHLHVDQHQRPVKGNPPPPPPLRRRRRSPSPELFLD